MQEPSKTTVLCVDDQQNDRHLQRELFERSGFRVLTAENWSEASALLSMNHVDIVILDYRLVEANAIDLAIEIRKNRPRVPIILLSGFLQDVPEYFRRAVDGCLSKNSPLENWVEMLRSFDPEQGTARAV